jgi:hypothetical protein
MRALSERVDVDGTADGTTVGLRFVFAERADGADVRVV